MEDKETGWKYIAEGNDEVADTKAKPKKSVKDFSWSATNSPVYKKSARWYIYLAIITIVTAVIIYLLTSDKITTGVVVFCGLIFGVYAARKPIEINYSVNDVGFTIGTKEYTFNRFKCFSILSAGDHMSIALTPLKRFMPYLYINFASDNESKITEIISQNLPIEKSKIDPIERFMRYIGF